MKKLPLFFVAALTGCSQAPGADKSELLCEFELHKLNQCSYRDYVVDIQSTPIALDEVILKTLAVDVSGVHYSLEISSDTSLLEGDRGFISFEDINFDGTPDLGITTSFGLANLYMDYWVFDKANKYFVKIGNYTQFTLNIESKTLSNQEKNSAVSYQKHQYFFDGLKLLEK